MLDKDIPIILPFVVDEGFFVYDMYKNKIIGLPMAFMPEVKCILKLGKKAYLEQQKSSYEHDAIVHLIDKGFFQTSHIKTIEFPYKNKAVTIAQRCLRHMVLQVTKKCNFKCRYCGYASSEFSRNHKAVNMDWGCAQKAIDFLFMHSMDAKVVMLSFYGGEPMLNFELIKECIEYADCLFKTKQILYSITCNGSLLSDEQITYLKKHNVKLTISLDGPEQIQNRNRKFLNSGIGTYDVVSKNVTNIINKHSEYFFENVTFNPVLINEADRNEVKHYFYDHLKISKDKISPKNANLSGMDYIHPVLFDDVSDMIDESASFGKTLSRIGEYEAIPSTYCHGGPCIPGFTKLMVNTEGRFYLCEKVNELNKSYELGDVDNGYNHQAINKLYDIVKLTENKCRKCWQIRFCNVCALNCGSCDLDGFTAEQKEMKCVEQGKMLLSHFKKIAKKGCAIG